ncbi:MAG: dTDP-4-dehydrorhamnose reductase [Candidatus Gracilibacteria bacterium]
MNILLIGKNGQLGKAFEKELIERNISYTAVGHSECDITDTSALEKLILSVKPTHIINTSAYNLVDKAENEGKIDSYKTNSEALKKLAQFAHEYGAKLVHYGSDYVFDGNKKTLYTEEDPQQPLNEYGKSKAHGEQEVLVYPEHLVLRTSWVYGDGEQNFIFKFLKNAEQKDILPGTFDEISVPTSTRLLVELTLKALDKDLSGLYHVVNSGYCSRADWAREILKIKGMKKSIEEVSITTWNLPAKRPTFSAMDNSKIAHDLQIEIPDWRDELFDFLSRK